NNEQDAASSDAPIVPDGGDAAPTPGPDIDLSPSELVFSAFLGMKSAERVLTIRNAGRDPLQVTSLAFRVPTGNFAAVMPPPTPFRVAPGAETTVRVVFSPPAQGMPGVDQG